MVGSASPLKPRRVQFSVARNGKFTVATNTRCRLAALQDVPLRAYARVASEVEGIALWLVGSGPDEERLRKLVAELGVSGLRFLGHQEHDTLARFYRAARVVVIPSLWLENAPLVTCEAMAHGRPILASAVGGLPELVADRDNGYLCARRDAAGFAAELGRLLTDLDRAREMGACGRRRLAELRPSSRPAGAHVRGLVARRQPIATRAQLTCDRAP